MLVPQRTIIDIESSRGDISPTLELAVNVRFIDGPARRHHADLGMVCIGAAQGVILFQDLVASP